MWLHFINPMRARRDISHLPEKKQRKIERDRQSALNHYYENPEEHRARALEYYYANRERGIAYSIAYRNKNRDKVNAYRRKRSAAQRQDPMNRVVAGLRSRVSNAMARGSNRPGSAVRDMGCTYEELRKYLEDMFEPGMTWENYGRHGWHIDHIIPLAFFDLTDRQQFLSAVHWTNLQPKWGLANVKKGAKIEAPILW